MQCLVCDSEGTIALEQRDRVPIAQNLVVPTRQEALDCPTGGLDMRRCTACGFVWNAAFDPALMAYDFTYDNDQNFSPRFRDHTAGIAGRVLDRVRDLPTVDLVEVGCGQGKFMGLLGEHLGERLTSAIGYDPAWQNDPRHLPAGGKVRPEYFGPSAIRADDPSPSLVISRHVIEHVPDPLAFLRAIRADLAEGTPIFIETPDVDWILRGGVFFDFYYEHCSLFTRDALVLALTRAGFVVEDSLLVFDDQYQLAVATAGPVPEWQGPGDSEIDDLGFVAKRTEFLTGLQAAIERMDQTGTVALWGAASKGVTICLTLPDAAETIRCVIDINERKQGCYLPMSGLAIVSPAEAVARQVTDVVVVNPTYVPEVRQALAATGPGVTVHSIRDCVSG